MMSTTYDPYEPSAMFQCSECGGKFRRDRCKTRKGMLECPRCLPTGICGTLRYVEGRAALRDAEEGGE